MTTNTIIGILCTGTSSPVDCMPCVNKYGKYSRCLSQHLNIQVFKKLEDVSVDTFEDFTKNVKTQILARTQVIVNDENKIGCCMHEGHKKYADRLQEHLKIEVELFEHKIELNYNMLKIGDDIYTTSKNIYDFLFFDEKDDEKKTVDGIILAINDLQINHNDRNKIDEIVAKYLNGDYSKIRKGLYETVKQQYIATLQTHIKTKGTEWIKLHMSSKTESSRIPYICCSSILLIVFMAFLTVFGVYVSKKIL